MKELKPNRRSKKMLDDFFVFDTETGDTLKNGDIKWKLDARPESFIFGCVYGKGYKRVINSVRGFQQEFQHPRYKGKKVFAHNAEYDLNTIFGNIYQFDNEAIFNGRFICATNGNCVFADSLNIYKASVKDIGDKMGYPKLELGDRLISKYGDEQREKDIDYCYRDCEIIWFALLKIFEDSGTIRITQASLSLNLFRTKFLRFGIKHNENTEVFRDSYFGGRCEAFFIGDVNAKVIDRNSAYSAEMERLKFPDPAQIMIEQKVNVNRALMLMRKYEGCIHCTVQHEKTYFGFLPHKNKDGKLVFPIGKFSGCWNFNELSFAVNEGVVKILSVEKIAYAPGIESPFTNYVQTLYKARFETDDKLEIERIKIFMNSLYGKFGAQKKEQNIYLPDWRASAKLILEHQHNRTFIDLLLFNEERIDAFLVVKSKQDLGFNGMSYSIVSFASYITSGQRLNLLKHLLKFEKQQPVYCDTDSIFLNKHEGFNLNDKHLGGWKLENKIVTEIRGLKNYDYVDDKGEKKSRIKGVPTKAKRLANNRFEFLSMVRTKESLRRNLDSGIFETREKTLSLKYDKRKVSKNGNTKPLEIYV